MFDGMTINPGYLAGLSVSILWTFTTLFFTAASKRIGPAMVNAARLTVALILHAITHRAITGHWVPDAKSQQVLYLCTSGLIGLTIGDLCIFQAFLSIGPRRALLVQTTAPILAAMFGWIALGETLSLQSWVGIGLTLAGIAWVIRERTPSAVNEKQSGGRVANPSVDRLETGPTLEHKAALRMGYALALAAALCQSAGLMLSKKGMGHGWLADDQHMLPQTATLLRMTFAVVGMIPILLIRSYRERRREGLVKPVAVPGAMQLGLLFASCGAVTGPFLGVWLSLISANRVKLGIAQTLLSLAPVAILPFAKWLYKEHISLRAIAGTLLAIVGVAVLCLD